MSGEVPQSTSGEKPANWRARLVENVRGAWLEAGRILDTVDEQRDIRRAREGVWVGEKPGIAEWVNDNGIAGSQDLYDFPAGFDTSSLSGAELRVAATLKYLSYDTMTRDQIAKYEQATREDEVEASRDFVAKLNSAYKVNA